MVDTITYASFLALLPPEQWLKGWRLEGEDTRPFQGYERSVKHSSLGIRLFIRAGMVVKVEVDLRKLLHRHNGRLIKTQAELDHAFVRLKQVLQTVCYPTGLRIGFHQGDGAGDTRTVAKGVS